MLQQSHKGFIAIVTLLLVVFIAACGGGSGGGGTVTSGGIGHRRDLGYRVRIW